MFKRFEFTVHSGIYVLAFGVVKEDIDYPWALVLVVGPCELTFRIGKAE